MSREVLTDDGLSHRSFSRKFLLRHGSIDYDEHGALGVVGLFEILPLKEPSSQYFEIADAGPLIHRFISLAHVRRPGYTVVHEQTAEAFATGQSWLSSDTGRDDHRGD